MYITVQRVRQVDGPRQGMNGFLYLHEGGSWQSSEGIVDVESVAEHPPGRRVEEICSVSPGGNRVLSFIDIVCSDEISTRELSEALQAFEEFTPKELDERPFEHSESILGLGIRLHFGASNLLQPELEYRSLSETSLQLLAKYRKDSSREPLQITLERKPDEWSFRPLTRGLDLPGPPGANGGTAVRIDRDTLHAFRELRGSIFPVVAESIFDMEPAELLDHHGVEVLDAKTREVVWRGP